MSNTFKLPALPYAHDALEPHIDVRTMEIHHGKHHAAYTSKLNAAVQGTPMAGLSIEDLLAKHSNIPAIRNNGGGFYNHNLFWSVMAEPGRGGGGVILGSVIDAVRKNPSWGDEEGFKKAFAEEAAARFGSGWVWLCAHNDGSAVGTLEICSTANQDNPLMPNAGCSGTPILGLDVWEHAYYLNYQNRRPEYIDAFWEVVNWQEVLRRHQKVINP